MRTYVGNLNIAEINKPKQPNTKCGDRQVEVKED